MSGLGFPEPRVFKERKGLREESQSWKEMVSEEHRALPYPQTLPCDWGGTGKEARS